MIRNFEKRLLDWPEELRVEYIGTISNQVINELSIMIDCGSEVKIDDVADGCELLPRCPPMIHFHHLLMLGDVLIGCDIFHQISHQNLLKDCVEVVHVGALRVFLELFEVDLDHFIDLFRGLHFNLCYIFVGASNTISSLFVICVVIFSDESRQCSASTFLLIGV